MICPEIMKNVDTLEEASLLSCTCKNLCSPTHKFCALKCGSQPQLCSTCYTVGSSMKRCLSSSATAWLTQTPSLFFFTKECLEHADHDLNNHKPGAKNRSLRNTDLRVILKGVNCPRCGIPAMYAADSNRQRALLQARFDCRDQRS